jgi:hypothetical protein
MLADALVEDGLPGNELKGETVLDYGESTTDEVGETAADVVAESRRKYVTAFSRHLLSDMRSILSPSRVVTS